MLTFIFSFLFFSLTSVAQTNLCDWPIPDTLIYPSVSTGVSRSAYDRVLDQVERAYQPVFGRLGFHLNLIRSWDDPTVNAQAWWSLWTCNVEIFGGLARWPGISAEAVRQVALHEIGHCLGGSPRYKGEAMSCEGQADYYSTLTGCRVLGANCKNSSLNLARALASMSGSVPPSRPVPPLPAVSVTYCQHPEARCRLITFDNGRAKSARPSCWFAN